MPTLLEVVSEHTDLSEPEHLRLRQLVSEWELVADLSFSDLVLWVPDRDPNMFWAAAQVRPTTGPTTMYEDVVGDLIAYVPEHLVSEAYLSQMITKTSANKIMAWIPVEVQAIPIIVDDRVIAVVEKHTNQFTIRRPSNLEDAYLDAADALIAMMAAGTFPPTGRPAATGGGPRVGDGFIRLDRNGDVRYASPNALSCYRRIGLSADLVDENLGLVTELLMPVDHPTHESFRSTLSGRTSRSTEIVAGESYLLVRVLPLTGPDGERTGAVVLCRDVTDLRTRERQLVTKDATIREIHHRVKNNLQTVAALLRMQSRRIDSPEARSAMQAARARVRSIALVHETLSQSYGEEVAFDQVADQLLAMVADVASPDAQVTTRREGSFGMIPGAGATNLALILTELCQNAVEHGLVAGPGQLWVRPHQLDAGLEVEIVDDGVGLPTGFALGGASSMGMSIVSALVSDLGATFTIGANPDGPGTRAAVLFPQGSAVCPR
ncbi:MAG: sensor histidine kinase [Propionibacteriaceae bacterium]